MTLPMPGGVLIGLGPVLMTATIRPFVTACKGALSPWNPTHRLVVQGI
jgi:hypothetical protein